VEGGASGGWDPFTCGGSGTGISLAGYESRYSRRVSAKNVLSSTPGMQHTV